MITRIMQINMKTALMVRMKTMLKKRKMKILINLSKMKKLTKTIARADFEYSRNDYEYYDNTYEYDDSD